MLEKEDPMIHITAEQRQAVAKADQSPFRLTDPQTQQLEMNEWVGTSCIPLRTIRIPSRMALT